MKNQNLISVIFRFGYRSVLKLGLFLIRTYWLFLVGLIHAQWFYTLRYNIKGSVASN